MRSGNGNGDGISINIHSTEAVGRVKYLVNCLACRAYMVWRIAKLGATTYVQGIRQSTFTQAPPREEHLSRLLVIVQAYNCIGPGQGVF